MEGDRRWAHEITLTKVKGFYRVTCRCGWQSSRSENVDDVLAQSKKHTGLVEREARQRGADE